LTGIGLVALLWPSIGVCLSGADAVRLAKAGVGKDLMSAIVREKIVETGAMTVDDLLALKKAGIGDDACIALVENLSFLKGPREIVYGRDVKPIKMASAKDLIALKEAGMSDTVLTAVVQAQSTRTQTDEREAALAILRNAGIRVRYSK